MLTTPFSGTQRPDKAITQIRDYYAENGPGNITNWHFTVILGVTLLKEGIEKNDRNVGIIRKI